MNKRQIQLNRQNTLNKVKRSSLNSTRVGCAKFWKGTTYFHFITIAEIVWKLSSQDYEVFSEVEFVDGGRADIFVLDKNGNGTIIEVLHTETEERFNAKLQKYPFDVIKVYTKDFNINKWEF